MFPDWYRPPQTDWPAQIQLGGFPDLDSDFHDAIPVEVEKFCRVGSPPSGGVKL